MSMVCKMKRDIQTKNDLELHGILKSSPLEDLTILKKVENILTKKRGYVFKIPSKNTPVISFMSGGLDSTVVTAMLMEKYKLEVFPIFFNRHLIHSRYDRVSVDFFTQFFFERYGSLFHKPIEIDIEYPPKGLAEYLLPNSGHIFLNKKLNHRRGIPGLISIYAQLAVLYAFYLKEQKSINVKTIIGATLPTNIDWFSYESLTTHRTINLEVCTSLKDFSWQFTSLPIEKEMGLHLKKRDLIRWGFENNIPLEKTRTCNSGHKFHCGTCDVCEVRKEEFQLAEVEDKTAYHPPNEFLNKVVEKIKKLI